MLLIGEGVRARSPLEEKGMVSVIDSRQLDSSDDDVSDV